MVVAIAILANSRINFTASNSPSIIVDAHNGWLLSMGLNPDGSKLATASDDGLIRVWRTSDWSLIDELDNSPYINSEIDWSSDGSSLVFSDSNFTGTVWNLLTLEQVTFQISENAAPHVIWNSTDRIVNLGWLGNNETIMQIWDWDEITIEHVADIPVGNSYWTVSDNMLMLSTTDNGINFLDIDSTNLVGEIVGHSDQVTSIQVIGGSRIVTTSIDRTIRIWNRETFELLDTFQIEKGILSAVVNPDKTHIAVVDTEGIITILDIDDFDIIETFTIQDIDIDVTSLHWHPETNTLAFFANNDSEWEGIIFVWDVNSDRIARLNHLAPITDVLWNIDGSSVIASSLSGDILILRISDLNFSNVR